MVQFLWLKKSASLLLYERSGKEDLVNAQPVTIDTMHSLSQDLETGCPNRSFIDFWVSKVWYKVHTTNEINPIHLQILLFLGQ